MTVGVIARPGSRPDINFSVTKPPWLQVEEPLACQGQDPELFFPWSYGLQCKDQIDAAKDLCLQCPVRELCLAWAAPQTDLQGIWAATTPADRRRMRKRTP